MSNGRKKIEEMQSLPGSDHLKNIIRILEFDFWSDDERLFFIWMYKRVIIEKLHWDNLLLSHSKYLERFFEVCNYE